MTNGEVAAKLRACRSVDDVKALIKLLVEKEILDCGDLRDRLEERVRSSLKIMAGAMPEESKRLIELFDALKEAA